MLQEQDSDVEKRGSGPASIDSVENHGIGDRKVAVQYHWLLPARTGRYAPTGGDGWCWLFSRSIFASTRGYGSWRLPLPMCFGATIT